MFKLLALCNRPRSRSDITGFVCNFVDNGKMNSQSTHNTSNRIQSNPKKQIKTNQGRHALAVFLSYCLAVLLFDSVGSNTRNPDGKSRQKEKEPIKATTTVSQTVYQCEVIREWKRWGWHGKSDLSRCTSERQTEKANELDGHSLAESQVQVGTYCRTQRPRKGTKEREREGGTVTTLSNIPPGTSRCPADTAGRRHGNNASPQPPSSSAPGSFSFSFSYFFFSYFFLRFLTFLSTSASFI